MPKNVLEIVDENGNVVGTADRHTIHQKGLLHREIHVWLYTSDGKIVFQHRAKSKDAFPDKLDASVGGHVEPGDSYETTAIKELKEETDISAEPSNLTYLQTVHTNDFDATTDTTNNALRAEYALRYDGPIGGLMIEQGESEGFEQWPIATLLAMPTSEKDKFIPLMLKDVYLKVYRQIGALLDTK